MNAKLWYVQKGRSISHRQQWHDGEAVEPCGHKSSYLSPQWSQGRHHWYQAPCEQENGEQTAIIYHLSIVQSQSISIHITHALSGVLLQQGCCHQALGPGQGNHYPDDWSSLPLLHCPGQGDRVWQTWDVQWSSNVLGHLPGHLPWKCPRTLELHCMFSDLRLISNEN